jgi:hypothetical protein
MLFGRRVIEHYVWQMGCERGGVAWLGSDSESATNFLGSRTCDKPGALISDSGG